MKTGEKKHESKCFKNFDGSSGSMEKSAAILMWGRSMFKNKMRYMTLVSDGDTATHESIVDLNPYGDDKQVVKMECINHVQKRLGSGLRRLLHIQVIVDETGTPSEKKIKKIANW